MLDSFKSKRKQKPPSKTGGFLFGSAEAFDGLILQVAFSYATLRAILATRRGLYRDTLVDARGKCLPPAWKQFHSNSDRSAINFDKLAATCGPARRANHLFREKRRQDDVAQVNILAGIQRLR